ncbi:MAG: radical SAM protein [Vicinamibacteria bacterium]|nr:radical SAM protein [Vicinamibacteria bacterium]
MKDSFGRSIDYLRVSITDRCNLRCRYCLPDGKARLVPRRNILTFEEITEVVKAAAGMGFTKVRLTGGEPLVRRNAVTLVRMIAAIPGIQDLAMSTNGTLLAEHAGALAAAGLMRVNVSLDSVDAERFRLITGGGDVQAVMRGISAASKAGLTPIKLNCVIPASSDSADAKAVAAFAQENGYSVRFIPEMDQTKGTFGVVEGGSGGDCLRCSRLRLSCVGDIRPCLFSELAFNVRDLGVEEALRLAVKKKPESGEKCFRHDIRGIGG